RGALFGAGGLDPALADAVAQQPEVARTVGIGTGAARLAGSDTRITIADAARLDGLLDLDVTAGRLDDLGADQIPVSKDKAQDKDWSVGATVTAEFLDGTSAPYTIGAIYDSTDVVGPVVMSRAGWTPHATQDTDSLVLVDLADGVSLADGRAAVERA